LRSSLGGHKEQLLTLMSSPKPPWARWGGYWSWPHRNSGSA